MIVVEYPDTEISQSISSHFNIPLSTNELALQLNNNQIDG